MTPPVSLNLALLQKTGELLTRGGEATLESRGPQGIRAFQIADKNLLGSASNFPGDRIGDLLVASGKLDPDLAEAIAKVASAQGKRFGDLLIADGLVTPSDLAQALEDQAVAHLERALLAEGAVQLGPANRAAPRVLRRHLGAVVLELFRKKIALDAISPVVSSLQQQRVRLRVGFELVSTMGLLPAELRGIRELGASKPLRDILVDEPLRRSFAALGALGLIGA